MKQFFGFVVMALVAMATAESALAQNDAGSKGRGDYNFYGRSSNRAMRSARDYSRDYRQYVQTAPAQKVDREIAKETADSIGDYIAKSQKHMAWMRKQAGDDKVTLASLDSIDKNLADAAGAHNEMHEICLKNNVDAEGSIKCCEHIDKSLSAAIAEHDKLMKGLAGDSPTVSKK